MTASVASAATELGHSPAKSKPTREEMTRELNAMSEAMIREEGLLNHSQAALLLDVSPARVTELVNRLMLTRFDFLGRTYVSVREVRSRREEDLKAGRPPRSIGQGVKASLRAALETDSLQVKQSEFQGPYLKDKEKKRKAKN